MKKQLFNDLLQSAQEMVAIEKGKMPLSAVKTHTIELSNIKNLRSDLHLTQEELSKVLQ